jgi:hypothetical protein
MKRIFQHKYIVKFLALVALCLALVSFSRPNIESYNSAVEEKQTELIVQANGSPDNVVRFSKGYGYTWHPTYSAEVAFSLILFFSLMLSQRILFSFLLAFLFIFQFIIIYLLYTSTVRFPDSYFLNYPLLSLIFVSCIAALSYLLSSLIYHFCRQKFHYKYTLK